MKKNHVYVIIGNSAAGLTAIESIRRVDKTSKIINISKEPHRPYSRCLLSYYLSGDYDKDILWIRDADYYSRFTVEALLNTAVQAIDVKNARIQLANNREKMPFDKLLIATGAEAKKLDVKGIDKKGVFVLRTLEDAEGILRMLPNVKSACILGGGLIGLRAAHALKKRGIAVRVIVKSDHILSQIIDPEAADIVREHLELNGIEIARGVAASQIEGVDSVRGILLDDGNKLDCQLVIIGKGVRANIDIIKNHVRTQRGILVDKSLKTDRDNIYAAGDVAETYDVLKEEGDVNQIWPVAIEQGKIAGLNMAGENVEYRGSLGMNSLDFFGLSVMSFGLSGLEGDEFDELIAMDTNRVLYRKIVLKGNRIVGGILINDVERHGVLLQLALQKIDISDIRDILTDEYFDLGKVIPLIKRKPKDFIRPEYNDVVASYDGDGSHTLV